MKIFLHIDDEAPSLPWHTKFREILKDKYPRFKVLEFNLADPKSLNFIYSNISHGDVFIGRIRHSQNLLNKIKPIYNQVCDAFENRCFPSRSSFYYYDDKFKQFKLFVEKGYPFPKSNYVCNASQINLSFPFVCKLDHGASSENVWLAYTEKDLRFPCLIQEFCEGNTGDVRINIIGDRATGYLRENRPDDFRASGSGRLIYPEDLPKECVDLAFRISVENNFESMAYDFVKNKTEWQVLEFSYTYIDKYVLDAPYYYDMQNSGVKRSKVGIYPEEFILDDLFGKVFGKIYN